MPTAPSTPRVDSFLDRVLARHGADPYSLLQILRDAQERDGWLPPATITYLAGRLGLPRAHVEGVAGFYSFLHASPAGRYRVLFSDNITDRMAGSEALLDRLCTNLWIERGKVSEDGLVSVDTTSCTGMCDQGAGAARQRQGDPPPHAGAHRRDRRADPRPGPARRMAGGAVRDRRQHPAQGRAARQQPRSPATRCARRSRAAADDDLESAPATSGRGASAFRWCRRARR